MDPFDVLKFCPKCGKSAWENKHANMRVCRSCGYEMYKNAVKAGIGTKVRLWDKPLWE